MCVVGAIGEIDSHDAEQVNFVNLYMHQNLRNIRLQALSDYKRIAKSSSGHFLWRRNSKVFPKSILTSKYRENAISKIETLRFEKPISLFFY